MSRTNLGLGNSLKAETGVLHSTAKGRHTLGRISDLVVVWADKTKLIKEKDAGSIRILVQALLEFAHPTSKSASGYLEFAIEDGRVYASVRVQNLIPLNGAAEKVLSQYWMNSEEVKILRRALSPLDEVEVRIQEKMNLIEWRVCRLLNAAENGDANAAGGTFTVLIDNKETIESNHKNFIEMGDLPYQDWLKEVYRNNGSKSDAGEIYSKGESAKNEEEWARVISDRQEQEVDEEIRFSGGDQTEDDGKPVVYRALSTEQDQKISDKSSHYLKELADQLASEKGELQERTKEIIRECKQNELRAQHEVVMVEKKIKALETVLRKKEHQAQKNETEIRVLREKVKNGDGQKPDQSVEFRNKAMQMFDLLKQAREENKVLQAMLNEKNASAAPITAHVEETKDVKESTSAAGVNQIDDLSKKLDRTMRALEAEKAKVKTLSERVIVAEKEAQSAAPMVEDLERKVEHTLKTVQQHKKETEQVKQKLVQSEAEKNKIKNELVKAQAQIQTLMKRHAS